MDSFCGDNVKSEKARAMMRYRRLRKIANFFRFVEVCLALIMLSWFSTRLPTAIQILCRYFREMCGVIVSPRFVFLVGNVIILILFAKSGQFFSQKPAASNDGIHLYDEFMKSSESHSKIRTKSSPSLPEEIVYQDKQTVYEESSVIHTCREMRTAAANEAKIYRRSQSENLKRDVCEKHLRELRRSETEKCGMVDALEEESAEKLFSEEDMSNEEFRRTIEAFIAKQARFHREESMAIVLKNQS